MTNLTEPHPAAPRRAPQRAPRWRHLATGFTVAGMLFAVTGCGPSASTLSDRFHAHVQQKWGEWVISIDDHKDPAFPSLNPSLQVKPTIPDDVFTQMRADLAAYKDGGFLGGVHVGCIETSGVAVPVSDATTTPAAQAQLEATLQLRRLLAAHGQQITPALSCQEPDVFYGTPAEFMAAARTVAAVDPDGTLQYRIRYRWAKPPGNVAVVWTPSTTTGTGDSGLSSWLPRGISGLVAGASRTASPMMRSSTRQQSQRDDLEHASRTRKWTLCEQPASKASA